MTTAASRQTTVSRTRPTKAWLRQTPEGLAWSVPARALSDFLCCTVPTAAELLAFCERDAKGVRGFGDALISVEAPLVSLGRWLVQRGGHDEHAACGGAGCAECHGLGAVPRPPIDWEEAV